jgi:serine protease Do
MTHYQTFIVSLAILALSLPQAVAQNGTAAPREAEFQRLREMASGTQSQLTFLRELVRLTRPSVAHIEATKSSADKSENASLIEEAGAGILIELDGRMAVLTNRHVVVNSQVNDIHIQLSNGQFFHPTDVRLDRDSDIAVLYIQQTDVVPAMIGDSDSADVGDFVVAVGSPFGLNHSVSHGILSGKGRRDLELGSNGVRFQDFLQTDAAINPGNSGGPLLNVHGEVIGLNTAIASNSGGSDGIGFAIPINMAMQIARELTSFGYVRRGFLGVSLDSHYNAQAAADIGLNTVFGARVSAITPGSPASSTNLQVGDIILKYDGRIVENDSHLVSQVSLTAIGREVELEVFRGGERRTVQTTIRDRDEFQVRK